jgi:hypothetical protein
MIAHTTIERSTGRITRLGISPKLPPSNAEFICVEGEYPGSLYYGENGVPVPRQPLPAVLDRTSAVVGETVTLSDLPVPCRVRVDAKTVNVTDGILTMTPQAPGQYIVIIDEVQYLPATYLIEVTE